VCIQIYKHKSALYFDNAESCHPYSYYECFSFISLFRDVEQAVNSLNPPPGPFNLGNTAYLGQETTQDRQALYGTLVNAYKWTDKTHEYSNVAHQILSQNSLKRSSMNSNRAKRNRVQTGAHNFSPP
jgi:mediator of RNA polymerase II transcription subunit 27